MNCANEKCMANFVPTIRGGHKQRYCSPRCCQQKFQRDKYRKLHPIDMRNRPRSPETRAKISAKLKGRKLSPQHLANRIKGQTGLKRSDAHRRKMSMLMRGRPCPALAIERSIAARRGKRLTIEHRAKLSAASKHWRAMERLRKASMFLALTGLVNFAPTVQVKVVRGKAMSGSQ